MKIVQGDQDLKVPFFALKAGQVFDHSGKVYVKMALGSRGVNVASGAETHFTESAQVRPRPNAYLVLDK